MEKVYVTRPYMPPKDELFSYFSKIYENKILTNQGPLVCELEAELKRLISSLRNERNDCFTADVKGFRHRTGRNYYDSVHLRCHGFKHFVGTLYACFCRHRNG